MSVKANVISNYIGQITIAVLNFIFIPTYIKYIGVEAYGLVGMFAVLQIALNSFDAAITPLLSREMSCYLGGERSLESIRNLLRTSEVLCFVIGLTFSILISLTAKFFANYWFIVDNLSKEVVAEAIIIAVFVVSLRAMEDLYKGALMGLQKQVTQNIIAVITSIFRFVGVIYALEYYEASIKTFYYWQLLSSIITVTLYFVVTYKQLPNMISSAKFSSDEIKNNKDFSLGSLYYAVTNFVSNQTDKILISKFISLREIGFYTLAVNITNVLSMISSPVSLAFYPKIVTLKTQGNDEEAAKCFHLMSQIINLTCSVGAFSLIFYGKYIIGFWTKNPELTENVLPYLRLLTIGMMFLINTSICILIPYISGKPIVSAKISSFGIIFIFISTLPLILKFGAYGAAYGYIIQNICVFLAFPFCFNCYLKSEQKTWLFKDVIIPNLIIVILFYITSLCGFVNTADLKDVIICVFIAMVILAISSFSCDKVREKILQKFFKP